MQTTAIIRQRKQLTIPEEISRSIAWAGENNVVRITTEGNKRIIIEAYTENAPIDWKKLRAQLSRVANYKGKHGNLSQFIAEDRYRH